MTAYDTVIEEYDNVVFEKYEDLSYVDFDEPNVFLFVKDKCVGQVKVYLDSEMSDRQYICINNEVIYLDTLTEKY